MVVPNHNFLLFITNTKRYILTCNRDYINNPDRWYYNDTFFMWYSIPFKKVSINPIYKQLMDIEDLKNHFIGLSSGGVDYFKEWTFEYLPEVFI